SERSLRSAGFAPRAPRRGEESLLRFAPHQDLSSRAEVCAFCRPQSRDRGNPQAACAQRADLPSLSSRPEWPVFSFAPLSGAAGTKRRDLFFSSRRLSLYTNDRSL